MRMKSTSSCCHKAIAVNIITHRCAGSKTWADSTTSPPPPSTGGTLYLGAWIQSYPYKTEGNGEGCAFLKMSIRRNTPDVHVQFWPFEVFFLLSEACPGQSRRGLAQITNEVIAEVERHCVLIRQQPPNAKTYGRILLPNFTLKSNWMNWLLCSTKQHTLPKYLWEAREKREKVKHLMSAIRQT